VSLQTDIETTNFLLKNTKAKDSNLSVIISTL